MGRTWVRLWTLCLVSKDNMILNRGLLGVVYGLSAVFGLATLFFPAPSIEGVIGLAFSYTYGALILIGAVICLIAVLLPNFKIELTALWAMTGGFLIYDVALWSLFFERLGVPDGLPPPYGPALAVLVLVVFLAAKMLLLHKKSHSLVKVVDNGLLG